MFRSDMHGEPRPEHVERGMRSCRIVCFDRSGQFVEQITQFGVIVHQPLVRF
jgi:hypothetical protein